MECLVCSAETEGYYYKINACRACASFFSRTTRMEIYFHCKKKKDCVVVKSQKFCRYCRMKKCLASGMVTDLSDSFRDYYLKGIPPATPTTFSGDETVLSDENELPETCFSDHSQFETSIKSEIIEILKKDYNPLKQPFKLNLCQQSAQAYELFHSKYKQEKKKKNSIKIEFSVEEMEKFLSKMFVVFIRMAEFFMDIEPFARLPLTDKVIIFNKKGHSFCDITFIAHTVNVLGRDLDDTRWAYFDGQIVDMASPSFNLSHVCNKDDSNIKEYTDKSYQQVNKILYKPYKIINPDNFELQYLLMKNLWDLEGKRTANPANDQTLGVPGLSSETLRLADTIQNQLQEELTFYYNYEKGLKNMASRIYKIHNLITARVAEVRQHDKQLWKTFDTFKFDLWIDDLPVVNNISQ